MADAYLVMWTVSVLVVFLFYTQYWLSIWNLKVIRNFTLIVIIGEAQRCKGKYMGGFIVFIASLFISLLIVNLVGLTPYVYRNTSHLLLALRVGLPVWLTFIISRFCYRPTAFSASFLPSGAPPYLAPFLILIETISVAVRPITLSVRLIANIRAGHIVLSLVGGYLSCLLVPSVRGILLIFIEVFYSSFEFAIGFIQAYIFCLLLTLYTDEHAC